MKTFIEILEQRIASTPGATQAGVATKAGLDNSTIRQMIEKRRDPREKTMRKIAGAFGESLETFMADGADPESIALMRLLDQLSPAEQEVLRTVAKGLIAQRPKAGQESGEVQ